MATRSPLVVFDLDYTLVSVHRRVEMAVRSPRRTNRGRRDRIAALVWISIHSEVALLQLETSYNTCISEARTSRATNSYYSISLKANRTTGANRFMKGVACASSCSLFDLHVWKRMLGYQTRRRHHCAPYLLGQAIVAERLRVPIVVTPYLALRHSPTFLVRTWSFTNAASYDVIDNIARGALRDVLVHHSSTSVFGMIGEIRVRFKTC
ncbi:hypothetical protein GQ600_4284 [Phytophthora cactorum]|nr:hypothetical protein GQ600_4284 [Phytophthora cactorum]